jgi:16S rRNA processing protein RimM
MKDWDSMAVVGRIARAHGLKGHVFVNLETDFPDERFQAGAELFISRSGRVEPLKITTVRFQRGRPVIGLSGVEDVNAAAALAGLELRVPIDELVGLPPGAYYHHDLVGCRVETSAGEHVGIVKSVEGGAGGSRLVIEAAKGDVLVPLAVEICPTIDLAGRRIVIAPPEGLLELNARS